MDMDMGMEMDMELKSSLKEPNNCGTIVTMYYVRKLTFTFLFRCSNKLAAYKYRCTSTDVNTLSV